VKTGQKKLITTAEDAAQLNIVQINAVIIATGSRLNCQNFKYKTVRTEYRKAMTLPSQPQKI
jgi:pyruvate/2-oxoglutarate dehydrogenase complex dihydrolipoamide dehydrogenase (E3) component